jgi:hypothetical protein
VKIYLFCTPELMVATPAVPAPNGGNVRDHRSQRM